MNGPSLWLAAPRVEGSPDLRASDLWTALLSAKPYGAATTVPAIGVRPIFMGWREKKKKERKRKDRVGDGRGGLCEGGWRVVGQYCGAMRRGYGGGC